MPRRRHGRYRPSTTAALSEKEIEAGIMDDLRAAGCFVTKTSQHRKPRGMTEGIPDLYVTHPVWGIRVWMEVKTPTGTTSAAQDAWHAAERAAGGVVDVVRSSADAFASLRALGAPIR